MTHPAAPPNPWGLSWPEFEVLRAATQHQVGTSKAIAARCKMGVRTVDKHMVAAARKMKVDRYGAVLLFDRHYRTTFEASLHPGLAPVVSCKQCGGLGFQLRAA